MVRIIIERHLKENKRGDLIPRLRELRTAAMHQSGYVTGETLVDTGDASNITVLGTWRSLEEWQIWEKSAQRNKLEQKIEPLLQEEPRVNTYQILAAE